MNALALAGNPAASTCDVVVDANLAQDDPENRLFRTLQAAYDAVPAGTEQDPTVIGIRPNVYHLPGGRTTPGLQIRKDYITLMGLTDDRRTVVLADNRGLQQGAEDNGYLLDVDAVGFSCRNLTIINHCNVDYAYPGDPDKDLKKRSDVITQAVALVARGDRHVYENVAIISRLDTMFLMAERAWFKNVYIEGTDDWIGGGGISCWEDCTLSFPTGNGVMLSMDNVFQRCRFISDHGMQFYKVGFGSHHRPSVLIDCTVEMASPDGRAAWMREPAPERPYRYSLTSRLKDENGDPAHICDSVVGEPTFIHSMELTEEQLKAFNPWNLLRAPPGGEPDNWDPAGLREDFADCEALVYRIALPHGNSFALRTGQAGVDIAAKVTPAYAADPSIAWSTDSDLIRLGSSTGSRIHVTGNNMTEQAEWVAVHAAAANALFATAWIYVEPEYIDPPVVVSAPTLSAPDDGRITLNYGLALDGRPDQSLVTWSVFFYSIPEQVIAVSRGDEPLRSLPLTPGCVGKFIKATLYPKHRRSEPGPPVSVIAGPIQKSDITTTTVSPNFRYFPVTANQTFRHGMWYVSENWTVEGGEGLENGFGIHTTGQAARLYYQNDDEVGDMQLDLWFRPDKTAGQVFSVPGSPEDEGANNLHADIYIKYDPRTGNGYSLRFWRTTQSARKVMFRFYRIEDGVGSPLDDQQALSGVFKRDTHMVLKASGDTLSVEAANTRDGHTLHLESQIEPNTFGGAGMSWSRGTSAICSRFEISYRP